MATKRHSLLGNYRYHESLNNVTPAGRLPRQAYRHHRKQAKDQETHHPEPPLEPSTTSGLTSKPDEPNPSLNYRLSGPKCFDDGQLDELA